MVREHRTTGSSARCSRRSTGSASSSCLALDLYLFGFFVGPIVWGVQMIWIPFWAAGIINGVGHALGYRNFEVKDESRNISPIAIWLGGEELHNNHHADPHSAKFKAKWYEFDIGWFYIRLLSLIGLAKVQYARGSSRVATTLACRRVWSASELS